ncbi:MAG TPA: hypothetical protein VEC99_09410 [Clostridia bacterium]|nr:hypothetical protein [Clostridia bacterium]
MPSWKRHRLLFFNINPQLQKAQYYDYHLFFATVAAEQAQEERPEG